MQVVTYMRVEEVFCDICKRTPHECDRLGIGFHCAEESGIPTEPSFLGTFVPYVCWSYKPLFSRCHDLCDHCYRQVVESERKHDGVFEYSDVRVL